jgi:uncharacterized protein (DUF433 family)
MQLEDYFEFETCQTGLGPVERIRIKGHRIAVEHVLEHFKDGFSPETIIRDVYPSLTLEKVYATILYYLANRKRMDAYVRQGEEFDDKFVQKQLEAGPSEIEKKLVALKAERRTRQQVQSDG